MNIYLIGYRCTGKTTIGKSLAESIGWHFADADEELVRKNRMTVSEMVAQYGWDFFREKEREIIVQLSCLDKYVIATGGGVILNHKNVQEMKKSGFIVWLKASPEIIKQRIINDSATEVLRPALTSKCLSDEIEETLLKRTPLYENAMDFFADTDSRNIDTICGIISEEIQKRYTSFVVPHLCGYSRQTA